MTSAKKALPGAGARRRCDTCRRQFRPARNAPTRRNCYTCRPINTDADEAPAAPVVPGPGAVDVDVHPMVVACRRELGARAESMDGLLLLDIVRTIAVGGHTATRLTGLQRTYQAQRALVFAGPAPSPAVGDAVAESSGDVVAEIFGRTGTR